MSWRWLLFLAILAPRHGYAEETEIIFYDPDANHQAIKVINALFNKYLASTGLGLKFRPVQTVDALVDRLKDSTVAFAIISSDYLRHAPEHSFKPLLVPSAHGDIYYPRLLMDRGDIPAGDLSARTVAVSMPTNNIKASTERLTSRLEVAGVRTKGMRLLRVSKDVDALLALLYRQADAAVVTPASVATIENMNPGAAKQFHTVLQLEKVLRPPLVVVHGRGNTDLEARVRAEFRKMDQSENGRQAMAILGFDGWLPFDGAMLGMPDAAAVVATPKGAP